MALWGRQNMFTETCRVKHQWNDSVKMRNPDSTLGRVTLPFGTIGLGNNGTFGSVCCCWRNTERQTGDQPPADVSCFATFSSQSPPISFHCLSALVHPSIILRQPAPTHWDRAIKQMVGRQTVQWEKGRCIYPDTPLEKFQWLFGPKLPFIHRCLADKVAWWRIAEKYSKQEVLQDLQQKKVIDSTIISSCPLLPIFACGWKVIRHKGSRSNQRQHVWNIYIPCRADQWKLRTPGQPPIRWHALASVGRTGLDSYRGSCGWLNNSDTPD